MKKLVVQTKYDIRPGLSPSSYYSIPYTDEDFYEKWEKTQKHIRSFLNSNRKNLIITIMEVEDAGPL